MAQFLHTVRFFLGMGMLAAAVALVQPFAAAVVAARANTEGTVEPAGDPTPAQQPGRSAPATGMGGHAIPDHRATDTPGPQGVPLAGDDPFAPASAPPPPAPLPVSGLDLSPSAPPLDSTYRSTVDIPPPPLLDGHAPPPLSAGWAVHDVVRQPAPASQPFQQEATATEYVVRDGDDLTGIALRVYGHAGAASALWSANRDRLTDPQLLPIGLPLQLPPTWMLPSALGAQGGASSLAIEPTLAAQSSDRSVTTAAMAARQETVPPVVGSGPPESPWLQEPMAEASAAIPAASSTRFEAALAVQPTRPDSVRVGAGDSLESIAFKFYGDRAMAPRIWQANRDRMRSPDLLVPGSELRLP
jgi:nucleoid-associated protein YgaU